MFRKAGAKRFLYFLFCFVLFSPIMDFPLSLDLFGNVVQHSTARHSLDQLT